MELETRAELQAYKALSLKLMEERDGYLHILKALAEQNDLYLLFRGNSRWKMQHYGVISHGYPGVTPKQMCEEKLGKVGYCWSEYGNFAVVSLRIDDQPERGE